VAVLAGYHHTLAECSGDGSGEVNTGGEPLRKALVVLEVLAESPKPLTLSELAPLVGVPRSTLHRLMRVLTELRLVVRTEAKGYELGDYLFDLAAARGLPKLRDLSHALTPFLLELFHLTRQIVSVATLSGTEVQYTGTLHDHGNAKLAMVLRQPVPAHCSAAGKLLLAGRSLPTVPRAAYTRWTVTSADRMNRELDQIRQTGLAYAKSEYVPELVEVAAPVHLGAVEPVAAIVVGGAVNQMDLRRIGRVLRETVDNVEEALLGT
jgi:IclR family transcriptional regulator, KDG regulon repressor